MTTQKRIERKAVSLFAQVNGYNYCVDSVVEFEHQSPLIQSGWLSIAKKVVRLENRVRIMRYNEKQLKYKVQSIGT